MDYTRIKLSTAEAVTTVTLADPATLNAAGLPMVEELIDAFRRIAGGEFASRAVVLTGEGRSVCSGADLSDTARLGRGPDRDLGAALESHYRPFIELMRDCPVPIVAAVNGVCAGIGCAFALAADLIVTSESAAFVVAFRRIGLVPDGGLTWLLPRIVGKARAMELMLLGDALPAREALAWGLVNRVVADEALAAEATAMAARLATGPASLASIRRLTWQGMTGDWDAQLEAEGRAQTAAGRTDDFVEGVQAFLQKRPAAFRGR